VTVAITVLVAVLITETELDWEFATYTRDPSGVNATPIGLAPTPIVAFTVLVAVSTTETELEPEFVT
jgi:hypothetical protein